MSDLCTSLLPEFKSKIIVSNNLVDGFKNYKKEAQLLIAQSRTAAFAEALALDVDYCWSLDSDVLPHANNLKSLLDSINFDNNYYSVATCTYPSQGGGGMLGGRGTPHEQILPDFTPDERELPKEMEARMAELKKLILAHEKNLNDLRDANATNDEKGKKASEIVEKLQAFHKELQEHNEECKKFPPKGNVWALNAKGWKKRGWLEHAYPAIGKGAVVPSDWCGFGNTLMNREALAYADFIGYEGGGTEDLHVVWAKWNKAGLRINALPHSPCDHVIRNPGNPGRYCLIQTTHETEGECVGHIRHRSLPWYSMDLGEKFDEKNDGKLLPPPEAVKPEDSKKETAPKPVA